jgi:HK97 family phage portal protein
MSSVDHRETSMAHLNLWGNAYSEIVTDRSGRVRELWPLQPDRMQITRTASGLTYKYDDSLKGPQTFSADEILHVRGLSLNGLIGLSPVSLARTAIGLGLAMDTFGSSFFANGAQPGVVMEYPGQLSDDARSNIQDSWAKLHQGAGNANRLAILEEGMKLNAYSIKPEDAQFLQSRKFQIEEIARMFRVPPHMIGSLDRATFNNIEHQSLEFVMYALRPWLVRWENAIMQKLMTPAERQVYFVEFLIDALLRGDINTRYSSYAIGRQWGWLSADDVRDQENMNPLPDGAGQAYLSPLNMATAGAPTAMPETQKPAPANQNDETDAGL